MSAFLRNIIGIRPFIYLMSWWPPFWGTGIWITQVSKDLRHIKVIMKKHFWNSNYLGTHFGGSLYAMCDPFLMLMMQEALGTNYRVWDQSATIEYKKPGRGAVTVDFNISEDDIQKVSTKLESGGSCSYLFHLKVRSPNQVIALVTKKLYIRKIS